jgi:hypothetical protein
MMLIYDAFILSRTVLNFRETSNYEFPVTNYIALEFVWNGIYFNTVWCFIAAICLKNMIDFIDDYSDPCSTLNYKLTTSLWYRVL